MKRSYCTLIVCFLFTHLLAQNSYQLVGQVVEKESNTPLEYATVSAYQAIDSSLIAGTISDLEGYFELEVLGDSIFLEVQFLGFEVFTSSVFLAEERSNFGIIGLGLSAESLAEIEVSGRSITSSFQLDKQSFDAQQFQNAQGGTANDVLSNLPSVSRNALGEISVRGASGFLVMINGRPIQGNPSLFLQQIPANAIDDIEIVTTPSAKFDPDGNAGIINIKTKAVNNEGQLLIVNTLFGLPSIEAYDNQNSTPRFGGDLTYSLKKGKWDLSLGADYRRYDISGRREGYVNTYLNEVLTEFPSDGERSFDEENYSGRLAVQYQAHPQHNFAVGLYAGKRTKERTADILYQNQQRSSIPQDRYRGAGFYYDQFLDFDVVFRDAPVLNSITYFNENLRVRRGDYIIGSFDYRYQINPLSVLKISSLYEHTVLGGPTDNASLSFPNTIEILQLQFNTNDNPLDGFRFQVDYEQTLGEAKWESGYLFRYLSHPGDFDYFDRDLANNVWIENPLFTNQIDLERSIHAGYTQLSGLKGKWAYNIGLRLEYFDRKVEIARPAESYRLDQWNLFPSLNFGYELSPNWQAKIGYNRRIERTTTFKMTPFPEREHSETLEQGDAELLPEYIDNVELGVVKTWGDHSLSATTYYRHVENVINRVNTVFNDTILNRIYTNAGDANALGFELALTLYPSANWRFYLGGNIYNYQIKGQLFEETINTSNTIYSINWNSNYQFTPTFSAQAAFNYLSRRVTAQGEDSAFYNPSLSIKKTFLDKKLSLNLQWLNIDMGLWAANEQRITTERSTFFTTTNYVYEVDILQLSLSYQLNSSNKKVVLPKSEFGTREF